MRLLIAVLIVLLLLLQYQLWFGQGSLTDVWALQRAKEAQRLENERLRERNASLEAEVLDLKQGLEAIEERARIEMGMIKTDEVFYQIIGEPGSEIGQAE